MSRKLWMTSVLIVLVALSTACGAKPQTAPAPNTQGSSSVSVDTEPGQSGVANAQSDSDKEQTDSSKPNQDQIPEKKLSIHSYYTDDDMLELKEENKEITFADDQQKYEQSFKSLQESGNEKLFALWQKVKLKSVSMKSGELTLDITLPDEARLGAGGETLAIEALKKTFFQFEEVKSIELLVDGQKLDTLMGHDELEHPMTRS